MNGPMQKILGSGFMLNHYLPFTDGMFCFKMPLLQDSSKLDFQNTSMQAEEEKDFTEQEMEI
jgi:hypothetical protein